MWLIDGEKVLKIIEFEDKWLFKTGHYDADISIAFDAMKSKVMDLPPVQAIPIEVLQEIADEIAEQGVDLCEGSEWRNYVNETVIDCLEIIDKHIKEIE